MDAGVRGKSSQVRLPSVRRRPACLYRRVVRTDGGAAAARGHSPAISLGIGGGLPARAVAFHHVAPAKRHARVSGEAWRGSAAGKKFKHVGVNGEMFPPWT